MRSLVFVRRLLGVLLARDDGLRLRRLRGSGGSAGTAGARRSGGAAGSGGSGAEGPLALSPGEVAELAVNGDAASVALATPTGNERYVLILASNDLSASGADRRRTPCRWQIAPASNASVLTGCSLSSSTWAQKTIPG